MKSLVRNISVRNTRRWFKAGWPSFRKLGCLFAACLVLKAVSGHAGGVVTNCTEAQLDAALAGGGSVTFACNGVITITSPKVISSNTTVDGTGHDITISGGSVMRLFTVSTNVALTLLNLTLANGRSTNGGAVYNNGGTLTCSNCSFVFNGAVGGSGSNGNSVGNGGDGRHGTNGLGGAIFNLGTAAFSQCSFKTNSAMGGNGGRGGNGQNPGNTAGDGSYGGHAFGGAVYNAGQLSLQGCALDYNIAQGGAGGDGGNGNGTVGGEGADSGRGWGGAIYSLASLSMKDCSISGGWAIAGNGGEGGAGTTVGRGGRGDHGNGGGMYNQGIATNENCTFSDNHGQSGHSQDGGAGGGSNSNGRYGFSSLGGGICNEGTNVVVNCTFFANTVKGSDGGNALAGSGAEAGNGGDGWGGNVYNYGWVAATNCTFSTGGVFGGKKGTGNGGSDGRTYGGNIANHSGLFTLHNTILAYRSSDNNSYGTISNGGYNISSDATPAFGGSNGSTNNTDPKLGLLAANGGFTATCALLSGSPAIDAGDPNFRLPTDQRGVARPTLSRGDIGAYELVPTVLVFPDRGWASEQGDAAVLSIGRLDYFGPLTVQYAISGSAGNGTDYSLITNTVSLSSNAAAARVFIRPLTDGVADEGETAVVTLLPSSEYLLAGTNAEVTIHEQSRLDPAKRYVRGTGTTPVYYSMVLPLDFQEGVRLADSGGNAVGLFPNIAWTNTFYHFDATNPAAQTTTVGRLAFQNPIVAFGSRVGGTPLHVNQTYSFGAFAGVNDTTNVSPLRIKVYSRTNFALLNTVSVNIPLESQTNAWLGFATNGYSQTVVATGLTTVVTRQATPRWGTRWHHSYILSHKADAKAVSYLYEIECAGRTDFGWMVLNGTNGIGYSKLYTLEFESRPPWHATFIDQPHFRGHPLPAAYQGKSTEELLAASTFLATNPLPSETLGWTNLDASPDLRRHPILDQFVADLNRDPIALANYVFNEIELTDGFGYDDDGNVFEASVNPGGLNRSALGTYLEGQGSAHEQCALLVYLLRQAGYAAAYVFPAEDSLTLLDTRLSSILGLQLEGAVDDLGQTLTTNRLIALNYPWVAARMGTNWVHLFPWLKDTEITEGLGLYDYLPTHYNNAYKWVRDYVYGKTNILFLSSDDDTPATLFPKFVEQVLLTNAPGVSLDDIGVRVLNRRNYYARWSDFPRPTVVGSSNVIVEHLGSAALTNVSPYLTNLFDTISVAVYSVTNPGTRLLTGELRMADLHNRKFLVRHEKISPSEHRLVMSVAPYRADTASEVSFSAVDPDDPADLDVLKKLTATATLGPADDALRIKLVHRRQRFLPTSFVGGSFWDFYPGYGSSRLIEIERPFRKGDLAAVCLNVGRVTRRMLQVHAEEQWEMEQMLGTNSLATNSLPADLYQGTPVYLQGMAYYEKDGRFVRQNERLHKVKDVSWFAAGLARLNAARNSSGQLPPGGDIDLVLPTVDMFYQQVGLVGNGSLHPDSGRDPDSAQGDCFLLSIANGSAQEHAILNQFLIQKEAVSTVKLLRLAQQRGTNGQPGIVLLTKHNYLTEGLKVCPTNGSTRLMEHDPQLWALVTEVFTGQINPYDADYSQIFITPWPVTNATASYAGMAALVITPGSYGALISGGINGATGEALTAGSFNPANTPNHDLNVDGEGNFSLELDAPTAGSHQAAPEASSQFDVASDQARLQAGSYDVNPNQTLQGQLNGLILDGQAGSYANKHDDMANRGPQGRADYRWGNGLWGTVADPVNTLTGEFYVDAVDLTLPGPMPLEIRRNYGSHNLSVNQLGYGWKVNYMPFLTVAQTNNVIYASEPDGSVLAFAKIGTDLWAPSTTNNPTLNNDSTAGLGSVANRFNARLVKVFTNNVNTWYLTNADGSLRIFEERDFPLGGSIDRLRPYLRTWYDNRGNSFLFEYGTNNTQPDYGQVRRILSSNGHLLGFQYDVYGRITEAYTLDGRRVRYRYDEHGDLVEVVLPDGSEWGFEYEHLSWVTNNVTYRYSTHLLTRELKPDGRALRNEYDSQRRVTNQWATVGSDLRLVRNATFRYTNGFKLTNLTATLTGSTTVLDYTNRALTYLYTNGLIRKIIDPLNRATLQTWYEAGETNPPAYPRSLKSTIDKRGLVTEYKYDPRGNVTNTTVRGNLRGDGDTNATATTVTLYNANNLPTTIIEPSGTTNLFFYTNTWLLARVEVWPNNATAAQAITNLFGYHNVTNATDGTVSYGLRRQEVRAAYSPDAATSEWEHDSHGFVTRALRDTGTSDPAVVLTTVHNRRGELIEQTDAAGRKTRYAYDARGRLEQREVFEAPSPGGEGQGEGVPLGWDYCYYNAHGELVWSDGPRFDPEDYEWRDYDGAGRLSTVLRWRSQARTDGTGVEAPSGEEIYSTTVYGYDPLGNQVCVVNSRGVITTNTFDAVGQLLVRRVLDNNGTQLTTESFAYEPGGQVAFHTNALGAVTETRYTSTGQPCFRRNADSSTNGWTYYTDGRLRREIQNNGAYWETTYNDASRTTSRVFYSPTGTPLATNSTVLDRRGNALQRVDAAFNVFTNAYDGLDRIKIAASPATITVHTNPPPASSNFVQQVTTYTYDASGQVLKVANALGDTTVTTRDALGRVTSVEVYASGSTNPARVTETVYATNHHSVTVWEGTGVDAIPTTSYTDTFGHRLLTVAYPASGVIEYTLNDYDAVGNLVSEGRYSNTNGAVALWTQSSYTYDGLNRLKTQTVLDGATTTFAYDALGNLTNRVMPGGLTWSASYTTDGRLLAEWDSGGGQTARGITNTYYSTGHPWAGMLQRVADGRGVARTNSYDDWLRLSTVSTGGAQSNQQMTVTWTYDPRGFLTNVTQSFASTNTGPSTTLRRNYDAYGQVASETVTVGGVSSSTASQGWDSAGRRNGLGFAGWSVSFGYRADGLMTQAGEASFGYADSGLLIGRTNSHRSMTVTTRDGVGRRLQTTTKVGTSTVLSETLTWRGDGLPTDYTATRSDFTDNRHYAYAPMSQRLVQESLYLGTSQALTNSYTYDLGQTGRLGVLTAASQASGQLPGQWGLPNSGGLDGLKRVAQETNTVVRRTARGQVNGPATVRGSLGGRSVGVRHDSSQAGQWTADLELVAGTNTLTVYADHPSGRFTTNATSTFTLTNKAADKLEAVFDGHGNLTQRVWKNHLGQTNRTQILTWDAFNRLVGVTERDTQNDGFNWQATFDGLGRRVRTVVTLVSNNVPTARAMLNHDYDPQVEFLEVAVRVNGLATWKLYGPDADGPYGGQQGLGGLELLENGGTGQTTGIVQDHFGNVLAGVLNGAAQWVGARLSSYGPVEGTQLPALTFTALAADHLAWRGKWRDVTGDFYWGARPYDPRRRAFIAFDTLGHSATPGGYAAFSGMPTVVWDPDGRLGKLAWAYGSGFVEGAVQGLGNEVVGVGKLAYGMTVGLGEQITLTGMDTYEAYTGGSDFDSAIFRGTYNMSLNGATTGDIAAEAALQASGFRFGNQIHGNLEYGNETGDYSQFSQNMGTMAGIAGGPKAVQAAGTVQIPWFRGQGVRPYEVGTYENLQDRSLRGDALDLDHQPSHASIVARAEAELGRPLTPAEIRQIRDQGTAVAVPQQWHRTQSPTYGGRNTPAQIQADAANPAAAAARDSAAMVNGATAAQRAAAEAAAAAVRRRAGGN